MYSWIRLYLFYVIGVFIWVFLNTGGRAGETSQTVHIVKLLNTNIIPPALFLGCLAGTRDFLVHLITLRLTPELFTGCTCELVL